MMHTGRVKFDEDGRRRGRGYEGDMVGVARGGGEGRGELEGLRGEHVQGEGGRVFSAEVSVVEVKSGQLEAYHTRGRQHTAGRRGKRI